MSLAFTKVKEVESLHNFVREVVLFKGKVPHLRLCLKDSCLSLYHFLLPEREDYGCIIIIITNTSMVFVDMVLSFYMRIVFEFSTSLLFSIFKDHVKLFLPTPRIVKPRVFTMVL